MIRSFKHPHVKWHIECQPDSDLSQRHHRAWSDELIAQVHKLSQFLLTQGEARQFPEIAALAFWCRQANLLQIRHSQVIPTKTIDKVFHIAPANVDTVFFYSLLLSVLSGNQNIVRISQRSGEVCFILVRLLADFLASNDTLRHQISIVEYPSDAVELTESLSIWADLRVVWGGDRAIEAISKIAPQVPQLCFPDRFSISLLRLTSFEEADLAAERLLTDVLPFNQQACSSPKAIFWWDTPKQWQTQFIKALIMRLKGKSHQFEQADQLEQFVGLQHLALIDTIQIIASVAIEPITIAELAAIPPSILAEHSGHGLLLASQLKTLEDLPFADKLQSVMYFGIGDNEKKQLEHHTEIKRFVPLGQALSFSHNWDGVNLVKCFS